MKTKPDKWAVLISQRVYGWLLRAYPPGHRAEYGSAMAQLFRDQCGDAWKKAGTWGLMKLWGRALPDLVKTSIIERLTLLRSDKSLGERLASLSASSLPMGKVFSRVFVAVFLSIFIGSAVITFLKPDSYISTTRLLLNFVRSGQTDSKEVGLKLLQAQLESINSDAVLLPVVEQFGLNTRWGDKYFAEKPLLPVEAARILRSRMTLELSRDHNVGKITIMSDDRAEAVELANAVVKSYLNYRRAKWKAEEEENVQKANSRLALNEHNKQVSAARNDLEVLRLQLGVSKEASGPMSSAEAPYWESKRKLDELVATYKAQFEKVKADLMQSQISQARAGYLVIPIIQEASLQAVDVRPYRIKDVVVGGFWGILIAILAGGTAVLINSILRMRRKNLAEPV